MLRISSFLLWTCFIGSLCACQSKSITGDPSDVQTAALDTSRSLSFSLDKFEQIDEVTGAGLRYLGDLDTIIAKRRLRVLVPYSQTSYYIDGVERKGIAYEAMMHFEQHLNQSLGKTTEPPYIQVVFIPLTRDQLIPALLAGYGDLIAENLTITPNRLDQVLFTEPVFSGAREILVSGPNAPPIDTIFDLAGKSLHLRHSSSFYEHILEWNDLFASQGLDTIQVLPLEEHLEDEDVLELVDIGLVPLTVMEENKAKFWSQNLDRVELSPNIAIDKDGTVAWALQSGNTNLKEILDSFIKENRKGTLMGNIIFNRYLRNEQRLHDLLDQDGLARFYELQEHFVRSGTEHELPWMLLAALAYQESRFDQSLRSRAGAVGIMQVLPSTAQDPIINHPNIYEEAINIQAGTKFLRFVIDQYFIAPEIDSLNAGLFGLAAYNAGPHRIQRLRKMTAAQGLNPNVWFNNVELMAAREIGRETVQYVSNIYKYYSSYRHLYLYTARTGQTPWGSGS
jgi:membrane-bound lytic murein transglycosylase MltF